MRREIICFAGVLTLLPWSLAHADLYDDYLSSKSKKPFVAFLARKGVPGHAFVGVGVSIDNGERVYERFFGLYPAEGGKLSSIKLIFSKTSGRLEYKWSDTSWEIEVIRDVSEDQRAEVLSAFATWSSNAPDYSLLANGGKNCSALVGDVAVKAGLKAPDGAGSTFPWNYVEAIGKLNK